MRVVMKVVSLCLIIVFFVTSYGADSREQNSAVFKVVFDEARGKLIATIPNHQIDDQLKSSFSELRFRKLTRESRAEYIARYFRDTINMQYNAFPMALGTTKLSYRSNYTQVTMDLAYMPKSASQFFVEIRSFEEFDEQQNLFEIEVLGEQTQSILLSKENDFTGLLDITRSLTGS